MNIANRITPLIDQDGDLVIAPPELASSLPGVDLAVRLDTNRIVIEDAVDTSPTFRVLLAAEEDGVHLLIWRGGGDLNP